MAAKQDWSMVSDLVGEIHFSLSGGTPGKEDFIPQTDGFVIRVTYANEAKKMKAALRTTGIAVQNICRVFYRKNKRFPFAPGKVQAVNGDGEFMLPPEAAALRALEVMKATMELTQEQYGAIDTLQRLLQAAPAVAVPSVDEAENAEVKEEYKFDREWLKRQKVEKLKVLAQDAVLEGYDEMTRDELVDELAELEK